MGLKSLLFGSRKLYEDSALSAFYSGDMARWSDIYNGGGDWRYTRKGGMNGGMRRVASLGAARAVCAELARLCFTEGTELFCSDSETEGYLKKVLDENGFAERFSGFVPTKWDNRGIYGGAFGSNVRENGKGYILAETQELSGDGLVIENKLFRESGGEVGLSEVYPKMAAKSTIKGLTKPLFVYFRAGAGNLPQCAPLGASVFAGAEDTLKSLDIVFDSLTREFVLGKKRIIVPYYAIRGEYDKKGELKRYFDVNDEVFEAFSTSDNEELKISDNTAELRVAEHTAALGELLDLLCMQVGLSEGALSYKSGTVRTATEVVSRNSRTYRTACFYRRMIANALASVAENICILGKMAGELSAGACETASIRFADGVCEDEGTKTERARALYESGLISRARAISEIYGISLDEAKNMEKEDHNGE